MLKIKIDIEVFDGYEITNGKVTKTPVKEEFNIILGANDARKNIKETIVCSTALDNIIIYGIKDGIIRQLSVLDNIKIGE